MAEVVLAGTGQLLPSEPDNPDNRVVNMWLSNLNSASSLETYRTALQIFVEFIPDKGIADVTTEDLMRFRDNMGGADSSRRVRWNIVRGLFTFAHGIGYIPFNPAHAVKPPRVAQQQNDEQILTVEDIKTMLRRTHNVRDRAIISILFGTGIRASELIALEWGDLKPGHPRPEFAGRVVIRNGKGGKPRVVSVAKPTWKRIMDMHLPEIENGRPLFCSSWRPRADNIKPLSRSGLNVIIKRAGERIDKPNISAHWFRHSYATLAIQGGGDLAQIRSDLGHSSIQTTSRYLHSNPSDGSARFLGI